MADRLGRYGNWTKQSASKAPEGTAVGQSHCPDERTLNYVSHETVAGDAPNQLQEERVSDKIFFCIRSILR